MVLSIFLESRGRELLIDDIFNWSINIVFKTPYIH